MLQTVASNDRVMHLLPYIHQVHSDVSCKNPMQSSNCASQRNALRCIIGGIVEERAGHREPRAKFYRAYWVDGRTARRARRDRAESATTEHIFEGW